MSKSPQNLPKELTRLVDRVVSLLGQEIRQQLGERKFRRIEGLRVFVKSHHGQTLDGLQKLKLRLQALSQREQWEIAHAFALMLELINTCESAYRCHRLKTKAQNAAPQEFLATGKLTHVLTAHPTESRSPLFLSVILRIQSTLIDELQATSHQKSSALAEDIHLIWQCALAKQKQPTVGDEADYIFSLALNEGSLSTLVKYTHTRNSFQLRTWVGGDKDGHSGVDETTMLKSLQKSRQHLLLWLSARLHKTQKVLDLLSQSPLLSVTKKNVLRKQSQRLWPLLQTLERVGPGDAGKVAKFSVQLATLHDTVTQTLKDPLLSLQEAKDLLSLFPGLVLPLELREDSGVVAEALGRRRRPLAISRMLRSLRRLSGTRDVKMYVRGFVISNCETSQDLRRAMKLAHRELGHRRLPIIPLFESAAALVNAAEIVSSVLQSPATLSSIRKDWDGKFEVMLGYSDSAKENGVFSSKYLIDQCLRQLEPLLRKKKLRPVFFHGSGGSVERGGGSIEEQTEWWPPSILQNVKMTIQGEMIYRTYSRPEILRSQIEHLASVKNQHPGHLQRTAKAQDLLQKFGSEMQAHYRDFVGAETFLDLVALATPYPFLQNLKLGSRPSQRSKEFSLSSLRAIPWVLCWTQTRLLMPTWLGAGTFWASLAASEKRAYCELFRSDALFRSYIKLLGFTLAKVELEIFFFYLENSQLSEATIKIYKTLLQKEKAGAEKFVHALSGQKNLLWHRPWLGASIQLRSPLIAPLNVLQTLALQNKDVLLLRESVSGIACGMLTTG